MDTNKLTKIIGAVVAGIIMALQGVQVSETGQVSGELDKLAQQQIEILKVMRAFQDEKLFPELERQTKDLDTLVEQHKAP